MFYYMTNNFENYWSFFIFYPPKHRPHPLCYQKPPIKLKTKAFSLLQKSDNKYIKN